MSHSPAQPLYQACNWQSHLPSPLSDLQKRWLAAPGSLTSRLEALGAFSLKVLHESVKSASAEQAATLGIAPGATIWCREVLMSVQCQGVVFARSLTPWSPAGPAWPELTELGQRALREILYKRADILRTDFAYCVVPTTQLPLPAEQVSTCPQALARRSCFTRHDEPLLISEYFLPGFWQRLGVAVSH